MKKISTKRIAVLTALALIPTAAFAATTSAGGGLCAAVCSVLGMGCCG